MGLSREWPVDGPFHDEYHRVKSREARARRSDILAASIVVIALVIVAAFAVKWYSNRVDCRLDVTVILSQGPFGDSPEPLEGMEVEMALFEGGYPLVGDKVDSLTTRTDDNRTAHGILVVRSVGTWGVWAFVSSQSSAGHIVDIAESDDGTTIYLTIPVIVV